MNVTYGVSVWFVKMSLLFLFLRLFNAASTMRYLTYGLIAFVTSAHLSATVTTIFGCTPVYKFWDLDVTGTCVNLLLMGACESGLNVLTDIMVLALPVRAVWGLRLPVKQRLAVAMTFGIGVMWVAQATLLVPSLTTCAARPRQLSCAWSA